MTDLHTSPQSPKTKLSSNGIKVILALVTFVIVVFGILAIYLNNAKSKFSNNNSTSVSNDSGSSSSVSSSKNDLTSIAFGSSSSAKTETIDFGQSSTAGDFEYKIKSAVIKDELPSYASTYSYRSSSAALTVKPSKDNYKFAVVVVEVKNVGAKSSYVNSSSSNFSLIAESGKSYQQTENSDIAKSISKTDLPKGYKDISSSSSLNPDDSGLFQVIVEIPSTTNISSSYLSYDYTDYKSNSYSKTNYKFKLQ